MTFNCNLGRDFTNATLTLCGLGGSPTHRQFQQAYAHRAGRCLLHKGRHRHGAEDIASGERQNLVIWNTNYKYRKSKRFRKDQAFREEVAPPDPRCLRCTAATSSLPKPHLIRTHPHLIFTSLPHPYRLSYTHDRDYPLFKAYPLDRTYRSAESREEAR